MYFEDCDYAYRMHLAGIEQEGLACMHHGLAQSWEHKTEAQRADHHARFMVAQNNYGKKWGGLPGQEVFTAPYDRAAVETR
jgi:GT2 family glycosyltransferase